MKAVSCHAKATPARLRASLSAPTERRLPSDADNPRGGISCGTATRQPIATAAARKAVLIAA